MWMYVLLSALPCSLPPGSPVVFFVADAVFDAHIDIDIDIYIDMYMCVCVSSSQLILLLPPGSIDIDI